MQQKSEMQLKNLKIMFEDIKSWFFGTSLKDDYEEAKKDVRSKGGNIAKVSEEDTPLFGRIITFIVALFKKDHEKN